MWKWGEDGVEGSMNGKRYYRRPKRQTLVNSSGGNKWNGMEWNQIKFIKN